MKKSWLWYLVYLFTFSFLLLEICLRNVFTREEANIAYWGTGSFIEDTELGYMHKPNYSGPSSRKNSYHTFVEIDSLGLRKSNKNKTLFLGDSFTFGLGVSRPFPSILKGINGGQTGYCIQQEVLLGKRLIKKFSPDTVILQIYLANDIMGDYLSNYKNIDVVNGLRVKKNRLKFLDFFKYHTFVGMYISAIFRLKENEKTRTKVYQILDFKRDTLIRPSLNALKDLINICKSENITLKVLFVPAKTPNPFENNLDTFINLLNKNQIKFLDLTPLIQNNLEFYLENDGHLNQKGHNKVAEIILKKLSR